uniref:MULE domain-containing protein n=1 Tax=Steinernema glaseri TaxID=37863 RepID=A0A1I7Y9Y9_9BILA
MAYVDSWLRNQLILISNHQVESQVKFQSIMNTVVQFGKSQKGGDVALYQSVTYPGHTYTFAVKSRTSESDLIVRCQGCRSTNAKFTRMEESTKLIPTIRIKNNLWTVDPDSPTNPHFCVDAKLVKTSTAHVVARQLYRKAAQSCETDAKKPKSIHNNMAASVSEEIENFVHGNTEEINALHTEVNAHLPDKHVSRRAFSFHNAKSYDKLEDPFENLPEDLLKPLSPRPPLGNPALMNRWIIFHETTRTNEPMFIMASVAGLACLRNSVHVSCDGNFKYNSLPFLQVYSMHSIFQNLPNYSESVLSVVALLPTKTRATYDTFFTKVYEALILEFGNIGVAKRFHFDMEIAAMNACRRAFPNCRITACYFHFAKNVMDKVDNLGLMDLYRSTDRSFYNWIRTFIGSALLPRALFEQDIVVYLQQNVPDVSTGPSGPTQRQKLQQLVRYARSYWFVHRDKWEQYDNDGPRTTNHAEGWHNQLRRQFNATHPQLGLFLKEMRKEVNSQDLRGLRLLDGARPKTRKTSYARAEERMLIAKNKLDALLEAVGADNICLEDILIYCRHQAYNCSKKVDQLVAGDDEEEEFDPIIPDS